MVRSGIDHIFAANTVTGPQKMRVLAEASPATPTSWLPSTTPTMRTPSSPPQRAAAGSVLGRVPRRSRHRHGPMRGGYPRAGARPGPSCPPRARGTAHARRHRLRRALLDDGRARPAASTGNARRWASSSGSRRCSRPHGIGCPIRSAGGIATWDWTAAFPGITEIQAGTYVVMDNFHGRMVPGFEHSLTIQASVISRQSRPGHPGRGQQVHGRPGHRHDRRPRRPVFRFDEEHGLFDAPAARAPGRRRGAAGAWLLAVARSTGTTRTTSCRTASSSISGRSSRAAPVTTGYLH